MLNRPTSRRSAPPIDSNSLQPRQKTDRAVSRNSTTLRVAPFQGDGKGGRGMYSSRDGKTHTSSVDDPAGGLGRLKGRKGKATG